MDVQVLHAFAHELLREPDGLGKDGQRADEHLRRRAADDSRERAEIAERLAKERLEIREGDLRREPRRV